MSWSFAIVNGKLAEIYFDGRGDKMKITSYCYVKKSEYKTKREQKWIREDTSHYRLSYRKGKYKKL